MQIRHRRTAAVLASAAVSATVLAGCGPSAADGGGDGGETPETLVIGAVPAEEATGLENSYEPLIAMLEDETGLEVEFQSATDYAAVIEALVAGQADMAIGSPFSYVRASKAGAELEPLGAASRRRATSRVTSPTLSSVRAPTSGSWQTPRGARSATSTRVPPPASSTLPHV